MTHNNFYDYSHNDEIMLEPRLIEYIRKKKYYQENEIEIQYLEKEYDITDNDMMKIRAYLRGDKKNCNNSKHQNFIDPTKTDFISSKFNKDPRFERLKKKQKKNSDAQIQRHNYGLMNSGYDMYRNDRPFASASGDDFKKSNFHPNQWFQNSRDIVEEEDLINSKKSYRVNQIPLFQNSRDIVEEEDLINSKKSYSSTNTYSHPKNVNNRHDINNDPNSVDNIIGQDYSYRNTNYNNKRETENNYRTIPIIQEQGNRDIDIDSYVRFSNNQSRGSKSIGYPNPVEHYFDYISNDIQNPNNVVFERGTPSRMFNKETARTLKRDIMK